MDRFRNRKITQSFKDAIRGIWLCIKSERNMRIHTVMAVYVLFFARFLDVSRTEYALLFAVIGTMITAETFNTSIEKLCNFTCNHRDRRIGSVKDIAAGAVLVSAMTAVCIGVVLLFKPTELLNLINLIIGNAWYIVILLLSILLSLIYIIYGPMGIKRWFHKKKRKLEKRG